jgi:putative Holliday junction resolvase
VRPGRRLAVDVGKVRVGLSISDYHGILASPLTNVSRLADDIETAKAILTAVAGEELVEIYVGLPLTMSGTHSASTSDAIALAKALASVSETPVRMIDERLTTVSASAALRASGKNSKSGRGVIDQVAATEILEQALSFERNNSELAGQEISHVDFD